MGNPDVRGVAPTLGQCLTQDMLANKDKSPRILFVIKRMTTGGAERHLAQILPALQSRGLAVELFVLERGGQLESTLAKTGVSVSGPAKRLPSALHVLVAGVSLLRRILTTRPDILHFFLPEPYLVGATVALLTRHRNCFMSRRSLAHYHRKHPWLARLERVFHRRMMALLGNSRAVVDQLVAESGDRSKVGLIYNGVRIGGQGRDRASTRRNFDIPHDAFVMAIVANLVDYKGHSDLLDALALVSARLPQPWRLLVIGRDEGVGAQLRLQADRQNLSGNILWLGERSDVEGILPVADLGLLVSHQEGFSNALIEMMAQGLPVIATAIGGNLDAVVDGQSGVLVPVQDPVRLGHAILELGLDRDARIAMGRGAKDRAENNFSQETCVMRYERLYRCFRELSARPVQAIIDEATLPSLN